MNSWIALLRGINVGGHNRIPMAGLSALFTAAGCESVATYIQSGNVVFLADIKSAQQFTDRIRDAISTEYGFAPDVHLLTSDTLRNAIVANPYPHAVSEPTSLHLFFMKSSPDSIDVEQAAGLSSASETFEIVDQCLYLHAPDGVARSKLVKNIDRALKVRTTARNWRTISKLSELVARIE